MPKYADPAVYPVAAPAATDTVMTRTAAGADGNFALGNLAGIAPVAVVADRSVYFNGTAWAAYAVTSAGRDFLSASTQSAQRTAIGAADDNNVVHRGGDETISGSKTWNGFNRWNITSTARIEYSTPAAMTGIVLYNGAIDTTSVSRSDLRGGAGVISIGAGVANSGSGPSIVFEVTPNSIRSSATNSMSNGEAARAWTQVFAQNTTISTSDARLKTDPRNMRPAEIAAFAAIARLPNVWRWLQRVHGDESCEPEGREARKHGGPTVQAAMAIMEANGLDPFEYSCLCYDQWDAEPEQWSEWPEERDEDGNVTREAGRELVQEGRPAGDRYSFRKEELLCLCMTAMAIQHDELQVKVDSLAARLDALEGR